ncbi:MAG TPA: hypothetical protein PK177_01465 [Burkholderiaceae bacterium]|nr:hypothetical protein [Burkholderiaceae bacterium]
MGVTPQNILHESRRRNDGLAHIFHDLKLMEREGHRHRPALRAPARERAQGADHHRGDRLGSHYGPSPRSAARRHQAARRGRQAVPAHATRAHHVRARRADREPLGRRARRGAGTCGREGAASLAGAAPRLGAHRADRPHERHALLRTAPPPPRGGA